MSKNKKMIDRGEKDYSSEIVKYYHQNVELRRHEIEDAIPDVMAIITYIVNSVHKQDARFKDSLIKVGSYWQGLKVTEPNEFDISVAMDIPDLNWTAKKPAFKFRMDPTGKMVPNSRPLDPPPVGYWRPYYKPGFDYPPQWQNSDDVIYEGLLIAANVRNIFKKLIRKAVKELKEEQTTKTVTLSKQKEGKSSDKSSAKPTHKKEIKLPESALTSHIPSQSAAASCSKSAKSPSSTAVRSSPSAKSPGSAAASPLPKSSGPTAAKRSPSAKSSGPAAARQSPSAKSSGPAAAKRSPSAKSSGSAATRRSPSAKSSGPAVAVAKRSPSAKSSGSAAGKGSPSAKSSGPAAASRSSSFTDIVVSREDAGPACTITIKRKEAPSISVDFSPVHHTGLRFPNWRPRIISPGVQWPSEEKIKKIREIGINHVPKADLEWQNSFAEAEKELIRGMAGTVEGKHRKWLHRVMKKLTNDNWCPDKEPVVTSYMLKNIFFWECEDFPKDEDWNTKRMWTRFRSMTNRLRHALTKRKLSVYFDDKHNLLSGKDERKIDKVVNNIDMFLETPTNYISTASCSL